MYSHLDKFTLGKDQIALGGGRMTLLIAEGSKFSFQLGLVKILVVTLESCGQSVHTTLV